MSDRKIEIKIAAVADTSGFREVEKSIFAIEDAAKNAQRELDVMEVTSRRGGAEGDGGRGILGTDITAGVGELANKAGLGKQFQAVSKLISADAAAVGKSVVLVSAAAAKAFQMLSGTVEGYKQLMKDAAAEGESLGPEIEEQIRHVEGTLGPLSATIDGVTEKWGELVEAFTNPIDTFSGLGDLRRSLEQAREQTEKLNALRLEMANDSQAGLSAIYGKELADLKDQEATMKRIAALRNELGSLEVKGSRQEVESARLRGGDVALAEANALAAELKTGLAKLGDNLRASQQGAETARTELDAAMVKYQDAIQNNLDKLDPEKFAKLSTAVDTAQKAFADANQTISDQSQIFEEGKMNILRGAENALAQLDTETKGAISQAAEQARAGIYDTIKSGVEGTVASAVQQIQADPAPATDAATQKNQELAAGLETISATIVFGGDSLNAKASEVAGQMGAAVGAVEGILNKILQSVDRLTGIAGRSASAISSTQDRVRSLESKVNQLFARVR